MLDKAWVRLCRADPGYEKGAQKFVTDVAVALGDIDMIVCPCKDCRNVERKSGSDVVDHLVRRGMDEAYKLRADWYHLVRRCTCDAYGTFSEVRSLIDSLERWDPGAIDKLPSCLRIVIQSIVETMEDIEREMKPRGRSSSVQDTVEEIKIMGRAYAEISKWARAGHVPTFDDYIELGLDSSGIRCFAMYSFISMEDCEENQTNAWFKSKPKMLRALSVIFRLTNDIAGFEEEMRRGEVVNGVNCYVKQHNVTKELAVREIKKMIRDNYKIMMEEFLTIKSVSRPILVRCFNIVRLVNLYYEEGDNFTNPNGKLKDLITSLFFHPLPL